MSVVDGLSDDDEVGDPVQPNPDRTDLDQEVDGLNFNDEVEADDDEDRDPDFNPAMEQDEEEWSKEGVQGPAFDPRGNWSISVDFDPLPAAPPHKPENLLTRKSYPN